MCLECEVLEALDIIDEALSEIETEVQPLTMYEAFASPGIPVCVADHVDDGFSVAFYRNDEGAIAGILVHEGPTLVGAFGAIPAAVVGEEVEYAESLNASY